MSHLLVIGAFTAGLVIAVVKGIVGKEIHGRIERRIERSVEATIASLPAALQAEYAEEWRAELTAALALPVTAWWFARGLRRSASQLVGDGDIATTAADQAAPLRRAPGRVRDGAAWRSRRRFAVLRLVAAASAFVVSLLITLEIFSPTLAIAVVILLGVSEYMSRSQRRRLRG